VHRKRSLALSIDEYLNGVARICVYGGHECPWLISTDWQQAESEGAVKLSNLLESRTDREIRVLLVPVVILRVKGWYRTVSSVAAEENGRYGISGA